MYDRTMKTPTTHLSALGAAVKRLTPFTDTHDKVGWRVDLRLVLTALAEARRDGERLEGESQSVADAILAEREKVRVLREALEEIASYTCEDDHCITRATQEAEVARAAIDATRAGNKA